MNPIVSCTLIFDCDSMFEMSEAGAWIIVAFLGLCVVVAAIEWIYRKFFQKEK